ncbi:MAG: pitrilysin family protein [Gammaproteobacteria bacterium]|nr:pitrilysin family protein [Gammaproteobacteria bacterium]
MFTRILLLLSLTVPAVQASPDIQHWTTGSGTDVYFVAADELPMLDVRVVFDAGSARDGDKPGVAEMTVGMLADGAGGMSSDEISTAFESIGANYGVSLDRDMASVKLRTLADEQTRAAALDTLAKVISQPDFPQDDFEREKQRTLIGIRSKLQSPGALASDAFYKALYGKHPYAHPTSGTEDSVADLAREDLAAFHERHYTAANATIAIVGAVTRTEAEAIADELLAGLPAGEPLPEVPAVDDNDTKQVTISFPSSQTHVLIGMPVVKRHDDDYFSLYVGNHVLGGSGMVSQLFDSIREKQGLSYSVYSYFYPLQQAGPFVRLADQYPADRCGTGTATPGNPRLYW